MKNDTLVIKKRGEDGNRIITVRIKEDTLAQLDRIAADPLFPLSREELEEMLDPRAFIGCCPSQVTRFLKDTVQPVVDRWGAKERLTAKLEV